MPTISRRLASRSGYFPQSKDTAQKSASKLPDLASRLLVLTLALRIEHFTNRGAVPGGNNGGEKTTHRQDDNLREPYMSNDMAEQASRPKCLQQRAGRTRGRAPTRLVILAYPVSKRCLQICKINCSVAWSKHVAETPKTKMHVTRGFLRYDTPNRW